MKNKILILLSAVFLMAGCKKDFLDKYPLDRLEDVSFWTSESNINTYAWNFYPRYFGGYASGTVTGWAGFFTGESLNDDVAGASQFQLNVTPTSSNWTNSFTWIRRANLMHERVQGMTGLSPDVKNHWLGVARLFRAVEYSNRVSEFGDYPWYDKVLSPEDPELYKPRDSRTFVMDKVLEDFRFAAEHVRSGTDRAVVDKYAVLALMSRAFLFEGTWQKYHAGNSAKATEYLEAAKWAANEVMASNAFSLASNYRSLFNSADLATSTAKSEIILYRRYENGILMHSMMSYHNIEPQTGFSKSAVDSYLTIDGLPASLSPTGTFDGINKLAGGARKAKAMIGRDPRINATFADSLRIVGNVTHYGNSTSGYASIKFLDETLINTPAALSGTNISDAPQIRYAEVLLNYAEAAAELGTLTQADLNNTINKLRNRAGFATKLPNLEIVGGAPAIAGQVYDDPNRDADVSAMIWEIRRERRVELLMEGFRNGDLRRWKKLHYADQVLNKDANRGAYIVRADFGAATGLKIENDAAAGYIQPVQAEASFRRLYNPRVYLAPIGTNEIKLYQDNGAVLDQNPGW
jgi:hypothetical protein